MNKMFKYGIIIFLFSAVLGYFLTKFYPTWFGKSENFIVENSQGETKNLGNSDKIILQTANFEEKLLPTATLILERNYEDCKHTIATESELPTEMINMTKSEIEENYPNWSIKDFSKDELVLYKIEPGLCGKHFVINSDDGVVTVYRLDENYNKVLYEKTDIYTEYLPEEDLDRLKQGIYVYSISELNSELENFE